jgi:hypothetical protein
MSKEIINLSENQVGITLNGVFVKSETPTVGSYGIMLNKSTFINNNCDTVNINDTGILIENKLNNNEVFFIKTNYVTNTNIEPVYTVEYAEYTKLNGDYYLVENPFKK